MPVNFDSSTPAVPTSTPGVVNFGANTPADQAMQKVAEQQQFSQQKAKFDYDQKQRQSYFTQRGLETARDGQGRVFVPDTPKNRALGVKGATFGDDGSINDDDVAKADQMVSKIPVAHPSELTQANQDHATATARVTAANEAWKQFTNEHQQQGITFTPDKKTKQVTPSGGIFDTVAQQRAYIDMKGAGTPLPDGAQQMPFDQLSATHAQAEAIRQKALRLQQEIADAQSAQATAGQKRSQLMTQLYGNGGVTPAPSGRRGGRGGATALFDATSGPPVPVQPQVVPAAALKPQQASPSPAGPNLTSNDNKPSSPYFDLGPTEALSRKRQQAAQDQKALGEQGRRLYREVLAPTLPPELSMRMANDPRVAQASKVAAFADGATHYAPDLYVKAPNGRVLINPTLMQPSQLRDDKKDGELAGKTVQDAINAAVANKDLDPKQAVSLGYYLNGARKNSEGLIRDSVRDAEPFRDWLEKNHPELVATHHFWEWSSTGHADLKSEVGEVGQDYGPKLNAAIDEFLKTNPEAGGHVANAASGFGESLGGMFRFGGTVTNAAANLFREHSVPVEQNPLYAAGQTLEYASGQLQDPRNASRWDQKLSHDVGGMATLLLPGGILGKAGDVAGLGQKGVGLLQAAGSALGFGATNAQQMMDEARKAGLSQDEALPVGALAFVSGAAVSELFPFQKYLSRFAGEAAAPTMKNLAKDLITTSLQAGATMGAQQISNNAIARQFYDKNRKLLDGVAAASGGVLAPAAIMGLLTHVIGGIRFRAHEEAQKSALDQVRQATQAVSDTKADAETKPATSKWLNDLQPLMPVGHAEDLAELNAKKAEADTALAQEEAKTNPDRDKAFQLREQALDATRAVYNGTGEWYNMVAEADAARKAIAAIPDAQPPEGRGTALHPDTYRDAAMALARIGQGTMMENLTAAQSAGLKQIGKELGSSPVEEVHGIPIVTDRARKWLEGTAPAAAKLIRYTEGPAREKLNKMQSEGEKSSTAKQETTAPASEPRAAAPSTETEQPPAEAKAEPSPETAAAPAAQPGEDIFAKAVDERMGGTQEGKPAETEQKPKAKGKAETETAIADPFHEKNFNAEAKPEDKIGPTEEKPGKPGVVRNVTDAVRKVSKSAKLKSGTPEAKVVESVFRMLRKASPEGFEGMKVERVPDKEWRRREEFGQTRSSVMAYNTDTNTLYLRDGKLTPENVAAALIHEAGHFAEKFYLGEHFTQSQWESLTDEQRQDAWRQYAKKAYPGDMDALKSDSRARQEWVAMQFSRVASGDTEGVPPTMLERLKAWLEQVRDIVKKWIGDGKLSTEELNKRIAEMLDRGLGEEPVAAAASPTQASQDLAKSSGAKESAAERPAKKRTASKSGASDKLIAQGREAFKDLLGTPAEEEKQLGLPKEKTAAFLKLAQGMIDEGIKTPEKMAAYLRDVGGGGAKKYAQAMWNFLSAVDPSLSGVHEWDKHFVEKAAEQSAVTEVDSVHTPKAAPEKLKGGWNLIGKNKAGQAVYENAQGTRRHEDGDFWVTEFNVGRRNKHADEFSVSSTPPLAAEKSKVTTKPVGASTGSALAASEISAALARGDKLDWRGLFAITDKAFGGTQGEGKYTVKDAYDALELGVNQWLMGRGRSRAFSPVDDNLVSAKEKIAALEKFTERLPTQSKRTEEQDAMQQFSTPPALAFVANWAANLRPQDTYLEPSAGTGGLAVFGRMAGVHEIIANELSDRRRDLLKQSDIAGSVYGENAEHLHSILEPKMAAGEVARPTVVVMNPPFSNAAKSGEKGNTMIGAQHVEEALKLLAPGGRLVAIVGEGMGLDKPTFRAWWARMQREYNVRANIAIEGKNYAKYGTNFGNRLLVIDKNGPTASAVVKGEVAKLPELATLLQEVRNERPPQSVNESSVESGGVSRAATGGRESAGGARESTAGVVSADSLARRVGRSKDVGVGLAEKPGKPGKGAAVAGNDADAGRPDGRPDAGGGERGERTDAERSAARLEVGKAQPQAPNLAADDESVFSPYRTNVAVEGVKQHPTPLVESAAMSAVSLPEPAYRPTLPKGALKSLSDAQLENVVYAGQAHGNTLPNGERRGYFIGDGTGVGKGRQIAAIIMDNWQQGRRKAVWFSKTGTLVDDAKRDLRDIGFNPDMVVPLSKAAKAGKDAIDLNKGVLFSTYTSLAKGHDGLDDNGQLRKTEKKSRLQQIAEWLGKDFDGVIAFDESHMAGNAMTVKGNRGTKSASDTGMAVVDLQRLLPKARVVYVSATGASEVNNLAYAERLGIWGPGTPFAKRDKFVEEISAGGVSAMEIVARDLKAMGLYNARTLSFNGVNFDRLEQKLSPEQRDIYNNIARGWQLVFKHLDEAMADSGASNSPRARSAARSAFFGAQQRFFNQLLTAMEMPAVLADIRKTLDEGHAPVLQLVNTNEATQDRELSRLAGEEVQDLEGLDLSPKDILLQYLDKSFPTAKYEPVQDPNNPDRVVWMEVRNSSGEIVRDHEAMKRKQQLLDQVATLKIPENPLEMVLNEFGHDKVAEITGRSQRVVMKDTDDGRKRVLERNRTESTRKVEAREFQDDKRPILVFSGAGGTGFSYHASRQAVNQRKRVHYLVQAGWRADAALQGFGRTHRSDQAQPPLYKLAMTDIQGHKRFVSTIARRLAQLGALTAGERKSTGQGLFSEKDNLEGGYANEALTQFFHDLYKGKVEGTTLDQISQEMGFGHTAVNDRTGEREWKNALIDEKTGKLNETKIPSVPQFLNRLLALEVDRQNQVFDQFYNRLGQRIENAKADGSFDPGTQTYKAGRIVKKSDTEVYRDPRSTAATRMVEIEAHDPKVFNQFDDVNSGTKVKKWAKNIRSGNVFAFKPTGANKTLEDGRVVPTFRRVGTHREEITHMEDFADKYTALTPEQARELWDKEIQAADPETHKTDHFIVGSFLPIWDRIKMASPKIYRFTTDTGETMLGARIPPAELAGVTRRLGAKAGNLTPAQAFSRVLNDGQSLELANGWKVRRVKVSGEPRIEVRGPRYAEHDEFTKHIGGFMERINYEPRLFLPTDEAAGVEAMKKLLEKSPVAEQGEASTATLGSPWDEEESNGPSKPRPVPGRPGMFHRSTPDTFAERGKGFTDAEQIYERQKMKPNYEAAKAMIEEIGETAAADLAFASDRETSVPPALRAMLFQRLMDEMLERQTRTDDPAEKERLYQAREALGIRGAEHGTGLGQWIAMQAYNNPDTLTELGSHREYTEGVRSTQRQLVRKAGLDQETKKLLAGVRRLFSQTAGSMNQAQIEAIMQLGGLRPSADIWKTYQARAAADLARFVKSRGSIKDLPPPLQELAKALVKEMRNKIRDVLPKEQKPPERPDIEVLADVLRERGKYADVWKATQESLQKSLADNPELLEKVEAAMANMADLPFSRQTLQRAVRDMWSELGLTIRDVAKAYYKEADVMKRTLAQRLIERTGLTAAQAEPLAQAIGREIERQTAEEKAKLIGKMGARGKAAAKVAGVLENLVKAENIGALDDAGAYEAIARKFGWPTDDPATRKKLSDLARQYQSLPPGHKQDEVATNILTLIRKGQGFTKWDVARALFYAHILSGPTTLIGITKGIVSKSTLDMASNLVLHPTLTPHAIMGALDGLAEGIPGMAKVLSTGYASSTYGRKAQALRVLDYGDMRDLSWLPPKLAGMFPRTEKGLKQSIGVPLNVYAGLAKYVQRFIVALHSTLLHSVSKEAFRHVAAAKIAGAEDGLTTAERNQKIRDLLFINPSDYTAAKAQAEREGFHGWNQGLRIGDILTKAGRAKLNDALDARLRAVDIRNQAAEKAMGPEATEAAERFASVATLTHPAEGLLGQMAKWWGQMAGKMPWFVQLPMTELMPFANMAANMLNTQFEYVPLVSLGRPLVGAWTPSPPFSKEPGRFVPLSPDERNSALVKSAFGTLAMLALMAFLHRRKDGEEQPFDITGPGPMNYAKHSQVLDEGRQDNSFKIGNDYYPYKDTPLHAMLAAIGSYGDYLKYEKGASQPVPERVTTGLAMAVKSFSDLTVLRNAHDLLDALFAGSERPDALKNWVQNNIARSVVPNAAIQVDKMLSPMLRERDGALGGIGANIPGLRETGTMKTDTFGNPQTSSPMARFYSPGSEDPVAKFLLNKGLFIPELGKTGEINGVRMTDEQYRKARELSGFAIHMRLMVMLPQLQIMSTKDAQEAVRKMALEEHDKAKARVGQDSRRQAVF